MSAEKKSRMEEEEETSESFGGRLGTMVENSFLCLVMGLGDKLGLFKVLSEEDKAKSSAEIATAAGLRERYVREWLGAMVAGGIVECDEEAKLYWLPQHRRGPIQSGLLSSAALLPMWGKAAEALEAAFRPDGPHGLPFNLFEPFYLRLDEVSERRSRQHLLDDMLPLAKGAKEALEVGGATLDLGCGAGVPSGLLAKTFPKAQVWGIDLNEEAIRKAREAYAHLSNIDFKLMDAGKLAEEWNGHFDLVTAFDAIHDQARPFACLREIHRVLKPGGWLLMMDLTATSNVARDKGRPGATAMWLLSVLHCLPVSLQHGPEAAGLGAMWGRERALDALHHAGFPDVQAEDASFEHGQTLYLAQKPPLP